MTERFHVVTGGPGAGKSSVIDALAAEGFRCMAEGGRAIIREQVETGGTALPWLDRDAFATTMLDRELRSYRDAAACEGTVVFDRAIPDVIGYRRLSGLAVPDALVRAARERRYARRVFIAPHWPRIFRQDAERRQSPAEAEATCTAIAAAYAGLGYDLVPLPFASVAARVRFIRSRIGDPSAS